MINIIDSKLSEDDTSVNPNVEITAIWPPKAIRLEDGFWNNYGIDCDLVQKIVSGEDQSNEHNLTDISISVTSLIRKKSPKTGLSKIVEYKFKHRPFLNCLKEDDAHLINSISEDLMIKPEKDTDLHNNARKNQTDFSSNLQALGVVDMIFKNMTDGFFVEAGTSDCNQKSVSLPLEHHLNWRGLLVEPLPDKYDQCKKANRKSDLINTCLGIKKQPHFAQFNLGKGVIDTSDATLEKSLIEFQCFPLYSILLALGNPTVNLFIMDIQGSEVAVLETIPWQKVDIQVISLKTYKDSSQEKIHDFLKRRGYDRFDHRKKFNEMTKINENDLFLRRDIRKKYNV